MKRSDLIRRLAELGCVLSRHGARHDWYTNPKWVKAVNGDSRFGRWHYAMARTPEEVGKRIDEVTA
jgi:hypothetical protein